MDESFVLRFLNFFLFSIYSHFVCNTNASITMVCDKTGKVTSSFKIIKKNRHAFQYTGVLPLMIK